jgi:hypothetical protein
MENHSLNEHLFYTINLYKEHQLYIKTRNLEALDPLIQPRLSFK